MDRQRSAGEGSSILTSMLDPILNARFAGRMRRLRWGTLVWLVNLLLLVGLAYLLTHVMRAPARERVKAPPAPPQSIVSSPADDSAAKSEAPPVRNLFGAGKVSAASVGSDLAASTLNARLLGTVSGDPAIARAVIEDLSTKVQGLYRIGETLQGAKIEQIERNRVVLARAGRREVLELGAVLSPPETDRLPRPDAPPPPVAVTPSQAREAVKPLGPNRYEINKQAFLSRVGGMEAVLKSARLEPYVVDGKTQGLRISGLEGISMAAFVGLENGDVIQSVNGQNLTSMQKAYQVMQKARSQPGLEVQLLRGDTPKKLSFSLGAQP